MHANVDAIASSHVCTQSNQFSIHFKPRYLKKIKCICDFCVYVWVWACTAAQINLGRLVIDVYRSCTVRHTHTHIQPAGFQWTRRLWPYIRTSSLTTMQFEADSRHGDTSIYTGGWEITETEVTRSLMLVLWILN